jgi:endonuclease/exonuclease/phosphatase family metal-dependent hydrolase
MDNQSEFSNERFKKLFGETPYSHFEYSYRNKSERGIGLATFSRYPIVKKGTLKFENTANESMYTDIVVEGDTIRIINNHLQSVQLRANNYAFLDSLKIRYNDQNIRELHDLSSRLKQAFIKRAEQAKKVSLTIKNSPHPVIVCGDFNDTPVSYSYHKIRGKLKDAWVETGKGWGNTYSGRLPFRIDYIFYDSYFKSLEFERVKTQLSDHYPILTVLEKRN